MGRLSCRWCLVTGSSRGIGRQIAPGLAGEGANVIVHGRATEHTSRTLADLRVFGVQTGSVAGELSDLSQAESLVRQVLEAHGGIDILYKNAAIQGDWIINLGREQVHAGTRVRAAGHRGAGQHAGSRMAEDGHGRPRSRARGGNGAARRARARPAGRRQSHGHGIPGAGVPPEGRKRLKESPRRVGRITLDGLYCGYRLRSPSPRRRDHPQR